MKALSFSILVWLYVVVGLLWKETNKKLKKAEVNKTKNNNHWIVQLRQSGSQFAIEPVTSRESNDRIAPS